MLHKTRWRFAAVCPNCSSLSKSLCPISSETNCAKSSWILVARTGRCSTTTSSQTRFRYALPRARHAHLQGARFTERTVSEGFTKDGVHNVQVNIKKNMSLSLPDLHCACSVVVTNCSLLLLFVPDEGPSINFACLKNVAKVKRHLF